MPNIRTYNAGDLALRPSEIGADAFAQAGRRIGGIYNDIASAERQSGDELGREIGEGIKATGDVYVDYQTHQDISHGMAASATLAANLQQQVNDITKNSDPNDPSVYGRFRDNVLEPALEKFQEGFNTDQSQKWAMDTTNQIREHLQRTISADMSAKASQAVQTNIQQTTNSLSNMVRNDPSALSMSLQMLDNSMSSVVKSSPNMSADDAARVKGEVTEKMKEQIVKSAVWGAIEANPDEGVKLATNPEYAKYINGQEVTQAQAYAKMQRSAALTDQERARTLREQKLRDDSKAQVNDLLTKLGSDDPQTVAQVTAKGVLTDKTMTPEDKLSMFRFVQSEHKPESAQAQSTPVYNDVLQRIYAPWGDANKITTIQQLLPLKDQMTRADWNDAAKKLTDSQSIEGQKLGEMQNDFFNKFKSQLVPPGGFFKGANDEGEYKFRRYIADKVDQYVRENKDPASLFKPGSSDFLGDPAQVMVFKKSMQQALTERAQSFTGNTQAPPAPVRPPQAPPDAQWYQKPGQRGHWMALRDTVDLKTGVKRKQWQVWDPTGLVDRGQ